jgi:hypothetical protein
LNDNAEQKKRKSTEANISHLKAKEKAGAAKAGFFCTPIA